MTGKRPSNAFALAILAAAGIGRRLKQALVGGTESIGPTDVRFWRSPGKQLFIVLGAVFFLAAAFGVLYLLFVGPRMYNQPIIKAFQARMPGTPAGAVPVIDPVPRLPTTREADGLKNPLKPTRENIARAKVYYDYYCVFCHGDGGRGDGPVGLSYIPVPSDLAEKRIQSYSDGRLLRAMLAGTGHAPMLNRIVLPEHRWYLVLYTRHLGSLGDRRPRSATPSTATRPVSTRSAMRPGAAGRP
jgi:hypothetical protein